MTLHLTPTVEPRTPHLPTQDRLALLHEVSRELSSILDPDRLLRRVADLVKGLIDYQLFGVLLYDPETRTLEHAVAVSHDGCKTRGVRLRLGEGLCGLAAQERRAIRVGNVLDDARRVACDDGRVRSELAVPMLAEGRLVGVIDLESYRSDAFGPEAEQVMSILAANLAVALENARLYARLQADERQIHKELQTAKQVQRLLLPRSSPWSPGVQTAVAWCPARDLGGDLYDFFSYDADRVAYLVSDVAGKGTGAALYGATAVGMLRGYAADNRCDPACILSYLNDQLAPRPVDRRFLAATFAVYDRRSHTLTLANAGLPYPYLLRRGEPREIVASGVPVGALEVSRYSQVSVELLPGDAVIFHTDGLVEALDAAGEPFGEERIEAVLRRLADRPAQEIADGLLDAVDEHMGIGREPSDDRTVVVVKRES